ncbi:uncharacterized protein LOC114240943 isoform X2 [Bombyx mandarina]|uniref:Uncharacterized protein LOC114240943 isoform X2 n=1 Tax=Bombyx mandarina TaxID=7092 RepID=A0A6J2JD81_BOMMA|nr:uncharacterized protein LOC114240943 isoform X2 [Bombyx mandarina]
MDTVSISMSVLFVLMCTYLFWMWFCFGNCVNRRQKTRNTQQRRVYVGTRARPSLEQTEPTIYVSPSNLPPPPKYECMAPPSYEEVVGVHYPGCPPQPITQPITAALAHHATAPPAQTTGGNSRHNETAAKPDTVVTVATEDSRASVTVSSRS